MKKEKKRKTSARRRKKKKKRNKPGARCVAQLVPLVWLCSWLHLPPAGVARSTNSNLRDYRQQYRRALGIYLLASAPAHAWSLLITPTLPAISHFPRSYSIGYSLTLLSVHMPRCLLWLLTLFFDTTRGAAQPNAGIWVFPPPLSLRLQLFCDQQASRKGDSIGEVMV